MPHHILLLRTIVIRNYELRISIFLFIFEKKKKRKIFESNITYIPCYRYLIIALFKLIELIFLIELNKLLEIKR